jgi:small subunit ribosomal protein S20
VANIKSQIKRNRQNERRRLRNKSVRSEVRTRTKTAIDTAGTDDQADALRQAVKRIDKAASAGVIHKNQAANRKSRLMRRIAALSGDAD